MEKEHIAFKTHDQDGDAWCEKVFLFENEEQVQEFFQADNPELIKHFTDQDDKSVNDRIENMVIYDNNPAKKITAVTFKTIYSGKVAFARIFAGYIIKRPIQ